MNGLEIDKIYTNGKLTREITKIDGYEIYYKTEKGTEKHCWVNTFTDWVTKGEKNNNPIKYKYEIIYTTNDREYITTLDILDIETAKIKAQGYKEQDDTTNVKIIEFKTTERIINL